MCCALNRIPLESNVSCILSETLSTRLESVFSDQTVPVPAYPADKDVLMTQICTGNLFTHQLLDPGPYFLGWLYHTLSCPMASSQYTTSYCQAKTGPKTRENTKRGWKRKRTICACAKNDETIFTKTWRVWDIYTFDKQNTQIESQAI